MSDATAPQRHTYTIDVSRSAMGKASYQFVQDGGTSVLSFSGAWDDVTLWANGTYGRH